jgi:hypothetical protein
LNRYILGVASGFLAAGIYSFLSYQRLGFPDLRSATGVGVAILAVVVSGALLVKISGMKDQDLGKLSSEKGTLVTALMFATFAGLVAAGDLFDTLFKRSGTAQASQPVRK